MKIQTWRPKIPKVSIIQRYFILILYKFRMLTVVEELTQMKKPTNEKKLESPYRTAFFFFLSSQIITMNILLLWYGTRYTSLVPGDRTDTINNNLPGYPSFSTFWSIFCRNIGILKTKNLKKKTIIFSLRYFFKCHSTSCDTRTLHVPSKPLYPAMVYFH